MMEAISRNKYDHRRCVRIVFRSIACVEGADINP